MLLKLNEVNMWINKHLIFLGSFCLIICSSIWHEKWKHCIRSTLLLTTDAKFFLSRYRKLRGNRRGNGTKKVREIFLFPFVLFFITNGSWFVSTALLFSLLIWVGWGGFQAEAKENWMKMGNSTFNDTDCLWNWILKFM